MVSFHYEKFDTYNFAKVEEDLKKNHDESCPLPWDMDIDVWTLIGSDTAWIEDDGVIVGYCLLRIINHHHYGKQVAISEVLYVRPEYRGKTSIMFLRYIEDEVKSRGAKGLFQASSSKKDISKLMQREGYYPTETVYFKEL